MKSWLKKRDRLLAGTILAGASVAGFADPAAAQEAEPVPEEEIVVTGSRIPQPNLESVSPVATVTSAEIQDRGVTRIEDMINTLPQAFAAQSSSTANGASGTAQADLRALGSQRTLVLIDGRRVVPGDPGSLTNSSAADLNFIPAALVDRVEVLTGGASAVYGADAVAGVVNFIMQDDFEGVRFTADYGFYQHDNEDDELGDLVDQQEANPRFFRVPDDNVVDGETTGFSAVFGASSEDGRGNVTAYADYRNIKQILQGDRGFSACTFGSGDAAFCAGSATSFPTVFTPTEEVVELGITAFVPVGDLLQVGPDRTLAPLETAGLFNFGAANHFQRPDERYSLGAFAHYDVTDWLEAYTQLMFMDDRTVAQIAPSGLFLGSGLGSLSGNFVVNCDNPFLGPQQVDVFCTQQGLGATDQAVLLVGHRNVNGLPRQDDVRHTTYRAVLGGRGDITDEWSYDIYGSYGTTLFQDNFLNEVSLSRVNKALINVGGECGVNVDDDLTNDDVGCVPLDIFSTEGPTQEQLAYIVTPGFQQGSTKEQVFSASLTGNLDEIRSPWAEDGLEVALGTEYRREEAELRTDSAFCPSTAPGTVSDLLGQGAPTCPINGAYDVFELYGEARVPFVQGRSWFEDLGLELGYRYSDYSTSVTTDTYKISGYWAPTDDIRFRGGFNRAVRAPNIAELFTPITVGLAGTIDPCAGADPTATLAQCQFSGVSPAQFGNIAANPASQYNALIGGDPTVSPEEADTWTAGFVFTPTFIPGLTASLDWFKIEIADRIGPLGADNTLLACLETGDPIVCALVNRAPGSGSLWLGPQGFIDNVVRNAGELETSGIDVEANYRSDLADWGMENAGALTFNFVGSWLDEYIVSPIVGDPFDCAGQFGPICSGAIGGFGNPLPEWRHKFRVLWETPWSGIDLGLTWRYLSEVELDPQSNELTGFPGTDQKLAATGYIDLSGSWDIYDNVTFRAGVNNLLDTDPPLTGASNCPAGPCSGNTWPGLYDASGRYFFFGLSADF